MPAQSPPSGLGMLLRSMGDGSCDLIGQILSAVQDHIDADISFLAEFDGDIKVVRRAVYGTTPALLDEGLCLPLQESYCYRQVRGELPSVIPDARNDARVRDLAITERLDIGCYVGVPVTIPGGRVFGTLCCIKHAPDASIDQRDVKFMRVLADLIGVQIGRDECVADERRRKTQRIQGWIDRGPTMVFQPIVGLQDSRIVGYEALARFGDPPCSPDQLFSEAWEVELGLDLELVAVRAAIDQLDRLPGHAYMTVNASPSTVLSDAFAEAVKGVPRDRFVVEVTEHAVVEAYEPLVEAVKRLAAQGIRIAVDDAGAGYSGLCHILRVAPKLVKLDLMLSRDVHADPVKQALVAAVVDFGSRTQVDILAEGIESPEDAECLRNLGVPFGQGFHFGRPAPMMSGRIASLHAQPS